MTARAPTYVYFIRPVGQVGPVKIGVSRMPTDRLYALAGWSPVPLEIIATIRGNGSTERQFHALFMDLSTHREWFRADPRIDAVCEAINAGTFDLESLPAPKTLPCGKRKWDDHTRFVHGLKIKVSHCERFAAVQAPADVRALINQLERLGGAEFDHAVRRIREFTSDPIGRGAHKTHPLCVEQRARYAARHGSAANQASAA